MSNKVASYDDSVVFTNYLESRKDLTSKHNNEVRDNLIQMLGDCKNKRVLDLGCGIGEFSKYFSENGSSYTLGIDISTKVIDYALTNNNSSNIEYRVMDINDIENLDEKFDIIFSDIVFNYIEDFEKLMKNIYNLLNHDGILVFSQVHPISTASQNIDSKWVKNEEGKLEFLLDNYSNVSVRKRKYFEGIFNFYHRRFEDIINISLKQGFRLVEIREPYSTEKEFNRPSFLLIKLHKS